MTQHDDVEEGMLEVGDAISDAVHKIDKLADDLMNGHITPEHAAGKLKTVAEHLRGFIVELKNLLSRLEVR